uniref:Uncharacterized protein n=1 Tax=Parascaris equorum TaxID=6256 RepID=A0A914R4V4_PAREQ
MSVHEGTECRTSVEAMYDIGMQPETQQIEDYPRIPLEPQVVFGRPSEFESAAIQQVAAHLESGPDFSLAVATSEQNLDLSQVPPAELAPPQSTDSLPIRTSSTSDGTKTEDTEHLYPAIQISSDEVRRLAEADIYVQDAMEYVSSQRPTDTVSGFVIEEDMLESVERSGQTAHLSGQHNAPASAEATSQLVKTNEVRFRLQFCNFHCLYVRITSYCSLTIIS